MDAGDLVPDEVTIAMVEDRLAEPDAERASCSTASRATSPRPRPSTRCSPSRGTKLDARAGPRRRRGRGRAAARRPPYLPQRCGQVCHVVYNPPTPRASATTAAASCFSADDTEETIRTGSEVYQEQTSRSSTYYADAGPGRHDPARPGRGGHRARARRAAGVHTADRRAYARPRCPADARRSRTVEQRRPPGKDRGPRSVIQMEISPEQIAKMREAGLVVARALKACSRGARSRGHHRRTWTMSLAKVHRRPRRDIRTSWATGGFPRRRSAPRSTTRSCTASRRDRCCGTATSSRSTAARSWTAGTATPRSPFAVGEIAPRGWPSCSPGHRGVDVGRHRRRCRRAAGSTDVVAARSRATSAASAPPRQVRHRRGLRGPRHRHRDAHGPARAELRRARPRPRARSWSPACAWRSSRWSRSAPRTPSVLEDDWTVITTDGTWSAHWEHSVAVTEEGPLVLTAGRRQGEARRARVATAGRTRSGSGRTVRPVARPAQPARSS